MSSDPPIVVICNPLPDNLRVLCPFDIALVGLKRGQRWTRKGWNGPGQYIQLQVPDEHSANTLPYLWIRTVQGDRVPWLASQTDLLADDWYVLAPE